MKQKQNHLANNKQIPQLFPIVFCVGGRWQSVPRERHAIERQTETLQKYSFVMLFLIAIICTRRAKTKFAYSSEQTEKNTHKIASQKFYPRSNQCRSM